MKPRKRQLIEQMPGMGAQPPEPPGERTRVADDTGHAVGETERAPAHLWAMECTLCAAVATLVTPADQEVNPLHCPECGERGVWQEIAGEHESFRVISKAPAFDTTEDSPPVQPDQQAKLAQELLEHDAAGPDSEPPMHPDDSPDEHPDELDDPGATDE